MARPKKKPGDVNKSQAVRDEITANPDAKVKEIIASLKTKGISVPDSLVYAQKTKLMVKKHRVKRAAAVEAGRGAGITNPVHAVIQVKSLAANLGGMKALKQLVDVLSE